jgi:hypothetical protein
VPAAVGHELRRDRWSEFEWTTRRFFRSGRLAGGWLSLLPAGRTGKLLMAKEEDLADPGEWSESATRATVDG